MSGIVFKKGQTTRIRARYDVGGVAANLGGKTLTVKAENEGDGLLLTSAIEVQAGATLGWFWFECTAANLTALGNPDVVIVVATAMNPDNTLFMDADPMNVAVEL